MTSETQINSFDEMAAGLKASLETTQHKKKGNQEKEVKTSDKNSKESPSKVEYDRWTLRNESEIDYGYYGAKTNDPTFFAPNASEHSKERGFYITTAINYTNGPAHMGHAYEGVTADAVARYRRILSGNNNCFFLTGADEHGQKISNTAADQGIPPIELCNKYVTGFQCLNQRMLVSNNDYLRTTSDRHKATAKQLWIKCAANVDAKTNLSDIYLSTYSGWYNVREETFVTDSDAKLSNYTDPASGLPLKKVEEESYFFRLSAYHDKLVKHIQDHSEFIQPSQYRNNIISRLESDNLRDLSISRTTFDWGINVPDGFDAKHVMYVWFDALTNYLTGVEGLDSSSTLASKFWPADVHIIGKDILWFHTVIWPCILMSANIPLPKTVFAHGFVNDKEGKKMSKSLGNVVDPHDMLDKFSVDTFRWYLCKEAPYGAELSFNEESLIDMHNSDLCDTLGNLIHRATNLCHKYCDGLIPDVPSPASIPINFDSILDTFIAKMANYELDGGVSTAIQGFRDVNGYLTEQAPWHMKGDELAHARQVVVRATLEAIYALSHLLIPFIPSAASIIFKKLNTEPTTLENLKVNGTNLRNLKEGVAVSIGDVLFTKVLTAQEKMSALEAAKAKAESYAEAQKRKKEKKLNAIASSKAGQISSNDDSESDQPEFTKIEIRVGKIVKVWNHPEADKLFCEEIDLSEESGPRQIASGLREHYKLEDMQDRKVLVVCNLKAAKIVGFSSNGMVLAAKSTDGKKVELVSPPADAPIGERVFIDGLSGEPHTSAQVKKKKIWENVAKSLKTVSGGVASWDGKVIQCASGPCTVASLVDAPIS